MWDKIIEGVLSGSPWAIILGLAVAIVFLVKMYRKDAAALVKDLKGRQDKLDKVVEAHESRVTELQDKRLEEAIRYNNDYRDSLADVEKTLGTLTEVVKARRTT